MSLINQVLKDLDQRRADPGAEQFPSGVRALPNAAPARRPLVWTVGVAVSASLLSVIGWQTLGPGRPLPPVSTLPAPVVVNTALPSLVVAAADPAPVPSPVVVPETPLQSVSGLTQSAIEAPRAAAALSAQTPVMTPTSPAVEPTVPPRKPRRDAMPSLKLSAQLSQAERERQGTDAAVIPPGEGSGMIGKSPVELSPGERAERLYRSALGLINQGRRDDGLTALRAALREDAAHVPARQLLIKFYLDSRALDSAQGVLRDGLAVLPRQSPWAMLLARLLADRGDNAGALQVLEAHQGSAAANAEYQGATGAVLQRLGRDADAELRYANAVRIDPPNGRWRLGLALAREAQGKTAEAREAYQQALDAHTLSPELRAFAEGKLK